MPAPTFPRLLALTLLVLLLTPTLFAQTSATAGRPIIFVHGWCGGASDWNGIAKSIAEMTYAYDSSLFSRNNLSLESSMPTLYYDGSTVRTYPDGALAATLPSDTRLFSVAFSVPGTIINAAFVPLSVANVSTFNKADELAHIIRTVKEITHVSDVILVAHSQGGLVARAYVGGLGRDFLRGKCTPQDGYACLQQPATPYLNDVAKIITIDTPQRGAASAGIEPEGLWRDFLLSFMPCQIEPTINRSELLPGSQLVGLVNRNLKLPSGLTVSAIKSFTRGGVFNETDGDDGIVTTSEQGFEAAGSPPGYTDIPNQFGPLTVEACTTPIFIPLLHLRGINPVGVLHVLSCVGAQIQTIHFINQELRPHLTGRFNSINVNATYNDSPYLQPLNIQVSRIPSTYNFLASTSNSPFYNHPSGTYEVKLLSTGPSQNYVIEPPSQILDGDHPDITFTIKFTSAAASPPSVTTSPASSITGDTADLNASIAPNGAPTTVWFEYGTDPNLLSAANVYSSTTVTGSGAQPVTVRLTGLQSNRTYYYRAAARNSASTVRGAILSFTTLGLLPAPALFSPADASTASLTPTFNWSPVAGKTSYRLMIATNRTALPTSATSGECGSGCILNTTPIDPPYVPAPGLLSPGTTYYWQVHARSTTQFGAWSSVYSFNTGTPSISSITINPSSLSAGQSASLTVTLNAPAPASGAIVSLSSSDSAALPVPSPLTIDAGQMSRTISVQTGNISYAATATVTASYLGSSASATASVAAAVSNLAVSLASFSPNPVVGGYVVQIVATLNGAAPAGGTPVTFTSSDPTHLPVPAQMTVYPGLNNVAVQVPTTNVPTSKTVVVRASTGSGYYEAPLIIQPVTAIGLIFQPSSARAGTSAIFRVYLNGPAPAGASVALSSSQPSILPVSSSVPIPTGATYVEVSAPVSYSAPQTTVTVSATYAGSTVSGSLSVLPTPPVNLSNLNLTAQTIVGGNSVSGAVWLTAPAPPGGSLVTLSSSIPQLQVPASVLVPAGATSAPFQATTSAVYQVYSGNLTAAYAGVPLTLQFWVTPPRPALASFTISDRTPLGGTSPTGTVTLTSPAIYEGTNIYISTDWYLGAHVRQSVSVSPGSSSVSFPIETGVVSTITPVVLTASFEGIRIDSRLFVMPPGAPSLSVYRVTLNPLSLTGGSPATGEIELTGNAPAGGVVLSLTSNNPAVSVTPLVSIPAGSDRGTFNVTTFSVPVITTAVIQASLYGTAQSALLTLKPASPQPPSNPVPFLHNPAKPLSRIPDGNPYTITLTGAGFTSGTQVSWNDSPLATTFLNNTRLQVSIPGSFVSQNGSALLTATTPGSVQPRSNSISAFATFPRQWNSLNYQSTQLSSLIPGYGIETGDFNLDGNIDAVLAGGSDAGAHILLGNGDGTFGTQLPLKSPLAQAVAVGDFNADGKPDFVTATDQGSVIVFLGHGDGHFTTLPSISIQAFPESLALGDLNRDGILDIVVGTQGTQAFVMLGNGDGTFRTPMGVASLGGGFAAALADLNGDSKLDLILSDITNSTLVLLAGNGDGTFQPQTQLATHGRVYGITVADLNGDGRQDVVAALNSNADAGSGGFDVFLASATGLLSSAVQYDANTRYYKSARVGDLDGDGILDLVLPLLSPRAEIRMFRGLGDGTFQGTPLVFPVQADDLALADLDRDGTPEILSVENSSNFVTVSRQTTSPILTVSTNSLQFSSTPNTAPPPSLLSITNTGGGTLSWTATANRPWIVLGANSGTPPSTLSLQVNPTGLVPGAYTGAVTIQAIGAAGSPKTVEVDLTVNSPAGSLPNGGFETGALGPWLTYGTATSTVTTSAAYSGAYGLSSSGGSGGVYVDFEGLTPQRFYHLTARVKASGSSREGMLWAHDGLGSDGVYSGWRTFSTSQWEQLQINFRATQSGMARLHLETRGASGSLLWDDVQITEGWSSDIENGTVTPWIPFGGVTASMASSPAFGLYSLALTGSGGAFYDAVGLVPGRWYHVKARVRSAASTAVRLWLHDTQGANSSTDGWYDLSPGVWKELNLNYQANAMSAMRIHIQANTAGVVTYWDEVQVLDGWRSDFESPAGTSGWTAFGSVLPGSCSSPLGSACLAQAGSAGGHSRNITGLRPGRLYRLRAKARAEAGATASAALSVDDTSGAYQSSTAWLVPPSNSWREFQIPYIAPPNGMLRIRLSTSGSGGTICWDDIELLDGWKSDFEDGQISPWTSYGSASLTSTSSPALDTTSLAMAGSTGGAYRDLTGLTPNQHYHVTARVRSASGATSVASLWTHDGSGANPSYSQSLVPSSYKWELLDLNFTATSLGQMRIHLSRSSGSGTLYWDDVQVQEGWVSDFEGARLAPWIAFGSTSSTPSLSPAYGSYSLAQSGGNGGAYLDVTGLQPGRRYQVSARARSSVGATGSATLWVHDTTGANPSWSLSSIPSPYAWDNFTVNFIATSTAKVRIHLAYSGGSGSLYWDEVRVSEGWTSDLNSGSIIGWNPYGAVTQAIVSSPALGAFSLSQNGGTGGSWQDVKGLIPGKDYLVVARSRSTLGATTQSILWVHDTTNANQIWTVGSTPSPYGWDERRLFYRANSTGAIRIHLASTGGTGTLYWDDIEIVPAK